MSKAERDKGARGELEVLELIRDHGWPRATRNFASGAAGNLDIAHGPDKIIIDVKRTERLRFREAWREAAHEARKCDCRAVVATRWNRNTTDPAPWLAILELEHLLELLAERDRYREALEMIAGEESGPWGVIAHQTLRGTT